MDFIELIEIIANFVRQHVVGYLINKVLEWLWRKIKPKLLKLSRKLKQKLKDGAQKKRKKWMNFRQRKRASTAIPALIFMNGHRKDSHSYVIVIMITKIDNRIIIITLISLR